MNRHRFVLIGILILRFAAYSASSSCPPRLEAGTEACIIRYATKAAPSAQGGDLTARMLTAPNALMGPGPSSLNWSPKDAMLAYVEPVDGQNVLWLYDAATGDKKLLLDPSTGPDTTIDPTSAQWSPVGDR